MSLQSLDANLNCFDQSRIVDPEKNQALIEENTCLFCNKLARDIYQCQLGCGGVFGKECFMNPDVKECPKCHKKVGNDKSVYKNRYINKLLSSQLSLRCTHHENGCEEILPYCSDKVQSHEQCCQYYTVTCDNSSHGCSWQGGYTNLNRHLEQCEFNEFECNMCKKQMESQYKFIKKQKQTHVRTCFNQKVEQTLKQYDNCKNKDVQNLLEVIKEQQEQVKQRNLKIDEIIKYSVFLEKKEADKRDKQLLLNDFREGILNFNSLNNLTELLEKFDNNLVKGVKLNDTNLTCYEYSYQLEKNFTETIQKIKDFAEGGEKNSVYTYARLKYWGDKDIASDVEEAHELAEKAIKLESAEGYWLMGDIYYDNKGTIKKDLKKAIQCYKQASKMGNPEATNSLGQMYDEGEYVKADEVKAQEYFETAARLGDYGGLYNLAVYHQEGYGNCIKNHQKAFEYYKMSARKGDIDAMKRVAILYKNGKGVCKNFQASNKWAKKAGYYKVNSLSDYNNSQSTIASSNQNSMTSIMSSYDSCNRIEIA